MPNPIDTVVKWWNTPSLNNRVINNSWALHKPEEPIRPFVQEQRIPPQPPKLFPDNNEVLATLYSEAQGQPPEGIRGVFNTIQNRSAIKNQPWSSTVAEKKQYTGYGDANYKLALDQAMGKGSLQGNSLGQYDMMKKMMEDQYQGQDITGGATHYNNPVRQSNLHKLRPGLYPEVASFLTEWKNVNQPEPIFTKKIGDHNFYKNIAPYR